MIYMVTCPICIHAYMYPTCPPPPPDSYRLEFPLCTTRLLWGVSPTPIRYIYHITNKVTPGRKGGKGLHKLCKARSWLPCGVSSLSYFSKYRLDLSMYLKHFQICANCHDRGTYCRAVCYNCLFLCDAVMNAMSNNLDKNILFNLKLKY